jgi:hypothetical protein
MDSRLMQSRHAAAGRGELRLALSAIVLSLLMVSGGTANDQPRTPRERAGQSSRADFIDRLLANAWKSAGIKSGRAATDEEFLRRAYLDIIGRIPSVQEAQAFLQTREPDRREKLVDYLLEHPDYSKNFATQWTVLLIGRGNQGRMVDREALTGWLRKQFSSNRPWNEVVYDLVTATGSNKANGAVNYVLAHLESDAVPLTSRTTRLFLGQQIQCTQCHDHKTNHWKQGDFWSINAFFKGIRAEQKTAMNATGLESYDHTELRDEPTTAFARFDKPNGLVAVAFPKYLDGTKIDPGTGVIRRVELAKMMVDSKKDDVARAQVNRIWAHFMGRGFVNPVDDMGPHNPPVQLELFDALTKKFRESGYDLKQLIRWITASRAYHASSVRMTKGSAKDQDEGLFYQMELRPMTPEQLFDSLLTATHAHRAGHGSDSDRKRAEWLRQFLFTFGNDEGEETTSFQGTIPQSLMMMNGELMRDAISIKPGSFLSEALAHAQQQSHDPGAFLVNEVYLAALSRYPTRAELRMAEHYLMTSPDALGVIQDLFWALLNSNEFILIH